ncbi:MAG: helix-turn-helix transcriptional regulator [Clostridiales bacterium]|nr:helix-turn-helix transcriptional regulator [Clostridiales bacterium]
MKNNICKFISAPRELTLFAKNFVLEKNGASLSPYPLATHTLFLFTEGTGKVSFNGREEVLSPGRIYFGFQGETFECLSKNAVYLYISFGGGRCEDLFARFGITYASRSFPVTGSLITFWQDNLVRATQENIDLIAECVLMYTFSRLVKVERTVEDVVYRMIRYTEDNFSDESLSLATLSADLGYNAKYLSHRFKEQTGEGFTSFLNNLRIKNALFLFDHGVNAVKNVALLCGYFDPLYFSKVFKEKTGMSPKEYVKTKTGEPAL